MRMDNSGEYTKVDVFHGWDLDTLVDKAVNSCPYDFEVYDMDVKFLNDKWIVISKIREVEKMDE